MINNLLKYDLGTSKLHYYPSSFCSNKPPSITLFPKKLTNFPNYQPKTPTLNIKSSKFIVVKNSSNNNNVSIQKKEEEEEEKEKETPKQGNDVGVKGKVVLKKKTSSRIKDTIFSFIVNYDDLVGEKVSFQLVSATNSANSKDEKAGNQTYLAGRVKNSPELGHGEYEYRVRFDWDEKVALPGAVIVRNDHDKEFYLRTITLQDVPGHGEIHFVCNSWVYPARDVPDDQKHRVFFTNKTYLPRDTPAPLREYRDKELKLLRGEGRQNDEPLKTWERVYGYALYNDLGNPDKGELYVRPVLGGTSEYPYPRRGRTNRPPTKTDPNIESRLSLLSVRDIYIPRDEKFGHVKLSDFYGNAVKSLAQSIFGWLDSVFDKTPLEFDSLEEVMGMHEGSIMLSDYPSLDKLRKTIPTKFLQVLFRSDGAALMSYPKPDIIKENELAWKTDEEFARQMLAGLNPLVIRRLEEFPPVSKLDPQVYGNQNSSITKECIEDSLDGLSVTEAIESNRLYILDHHDTVMPYLNEINTKTRWRVYATRTILFLKNDGTLKPLVIELSRPKSDDVQSGTISEVHTPANEGVKASLWWLAKTYATINDAAYHQLISHWLHTHAVIEPFIIAAHRHLSKLHPIHKLLEPHFRETMSVNTIARQIALNADGLFEEAVYPRQFVGEWTSSVYKDWVFTDQALPKDLMKRGMAVKDEFSPYGYKLLINDYPYAVDGLEIWFAIKTWVTEYCKFYYNSNNEMDADDMVAKDPELQSWWKEIRAEGHGDKKNEKWWPKMKTLDELIETCTTIIWVASALHAVVNFGQYPYGGYMPNRPTISRRFMPEPEEYEELEKNPEQFFLKTVTSQLRTMVCISVIQLISRHSEDEVYLGQREAGWTSDDVPLKALEEFDAKLREIEKNIDQRNQNPELKNRVGPVKLPFTLLYRSSEVGITGKGIPNSVSL